MISKKKLQKSPTNIFLDKYWPFLWIAVIGFVLYARTINFGFSPLDETNLIIEKMEWNKDIANLPSVFSKGVFDNKNLGESYYRPTLMLTFMIDTLLGKGSPKVYHFTNILLHILSTILMFVFFARLLNNRLLAFVCALIFVVHPLNVHAVAWIPGRNDTLLTIFVLSCFIFLYNYLKQPKWYYLLLHASFLFLSLLTKESAFVILPVLCLFYWYFSNNRTIYKLLIWAGLWIIIAVAWFVLKNHIVKTEADFALFDFKKIFLDASQGLVIYIGKIFLPINQSILPTVKGTTIFYGLFVIFAIVFSLIKTKITDYQKAIFGLAWFLLFISIPLLLATFDGMGLHYEHRMYLPLIGFLLFLTSFPINIHKISTWLVVIILVFSIKTLVRVGVYENSFSFAGAAVNESPNLPMSYNLRGLEYKKQNQPDLAKADFTSALNIDSLYIRALFNLGVTYDEMGYPVMAIKVLNKGLSIDTANAGALYARGSAYFNIKNYSQAISDYSKSISVYPKYDKAYNNRGNAYININRYDLAIKDFSEAIKINNTNAVAYGNRANAFFDMGKFSEALEDIGSALSIQPGNKDYLSLRAQIENALHKGNPGQKTDLSVLEQNLLPEALELYKNKQYKEAIEIFKQLEMKCLGENQTRNRLSHLNNIGLCYIKLNSYNEAEAVYSKILLIDPKYEKGYSNLGFLNKQKGNWLNALQFFKTAKQLNPSNERYNAEIIELNRLVNSK